VSTTVSPWFFPHSGTNLARKQRTSPNLVSADSCWNFLLQRTVETRLIFEIFWGQLFRVGYATRWSRNLPAINSQQPTQIKSLPQVGGNWQDFLNPWSLWSFAPTNCTQKANHFNGPAKFDPNLFKNGSRRSGTSMEIAYLWRSVCFDFRHFYDPHNFMVRAAFQQKSACVLGQPLLFSGWYRFCLGKKE
jgi:hypothetical protein